MYEENPEGVRRLQGMMREGCRMIEVARLRVGDVVQISPKQQTVEFVQNLPAEDAVLLRLSGEETKKVHAGFVYKLIRRADEDRGGT